MKSILVFAIIAAAAFAAGCRTTEKPPIQLASPAFGDCVNGLLITFTLDKKVYKDDEPVNAKVVFTNCSNEVLHFPICLDEDRNLFFNALLIGKRYETILVDEIGKGTFGTWRDDYIKKVSVISLAPDESYCLELLDIIPSRFRGLSWEFFLDEFKMYLIYRDYSWGHNGDRGTFKGRYWRGVCISRPTEISFRSADLPHPSAGPDDKPSDTPGDTPDDTPAETPGY